VSRPPPQGWKRERAFWRERGQVHRRISNRLIPRTTTVRQHKNCRPNVKFLTFGRAGPFYTSAGDQDFSNQVGRDRSIDKI
jgi:hypothetical protein